MEYNALATKFPENQMVWCSQVWPVGILISKSTENQALEIQL